MAEKNGRGINPLEGCKSSGPSDGITGSENLAAGGRITGVVFWENDQKEKWVGFSVGVPLKKPKRGSLKNTPANVFGQNGMCQSWLLKKTLANTSYQLPGLPSDPPLKVRLLVGSMETTTND